MNAVVFYWLAIPVCQSPATQADRLLEGCSYLRGLSETSVGGTRVDDYNCGLVVPVTEFASEPLFQYPWAVPEKFYTLFVVDPDVPNYAVGEFFLHMLKSNIPGSELKFKNNGTIKGDEYQPYFPPMPPAGSGLHRYISVLYQQADGNFRPDVPLERTKFRLGDWLVDKNLCGPVAGTQFLTQNAQDQLLFRYSSSSSSFSSAGIGRPLLDIVGLPHRPPVASVESGLDKL
ncbi:protein D3-like [Choristoneura fumiferana]|uniref:protein D3-like n=1 Tax=Choristoneura fumiferana TaxID=7141 RepID=UPI003D15D59F